MTDEPSNKREFTRVPVQFRIRLEAEGRHIPCTAVRTLSMNGMFVETPEQLPPGTECAVSISLLEDEAEIQLVASVVRNYPDGVAFQFTKILGPESYGHLRNLV
ncbi:MAG TPA: PilZ domain-containing protein, partial [Holophaga sp.]|nr:PilZ domain-containing protein [Holophaga sp.]